MKVGSRVKTLDGELATVISAARYKAQTGHPVPRLRDHDKPLFSPPFATVKPVLVWLDNSRTVLALPDYQVIKVEPFIRIEDEAPASSEMVEVKKAFAASLLGG